MLRLLYLIVSVAAIQVLTAELIPECGVRSQNKLLIGPKTEIYDYPWTVRLIYESDTEKKFFCGGVLISKRYVLTQAHCLDNVPTKWSLTSVRLGEYNITSEKDCSQYGSECADPYIDVAIEEKILHENHTSNNVASSNDIALLRLEKDVQFTDFISPICMPENNKIDYNGKELVVTGWGKSYEEDAADIKKEFNLIGLSQEECNKQLKEANIVINDGLICASATNTFCGGSAGNPLMVINKFNRWMLVGTESFGPTCRASVEHRLPTVYTDVGYYSDWILSHMKA